MVSAMDPRALRLGRSLAQGLPLSLGLALTVCLAHHLPAQEPQTAAAVTARGARTMARALDSVLGGQGSGTPEERTLFLLIDATPSLQQAGFVDKLEQALSRNQKRLAKTHIGVGLVGFKGTITLKPTKDTKAIVKEVRRLMASPSKSFQNVYADIRVMAAALAPAPGAHELALVSLDNGDAEDNIEGTVTALKKTRTKFRVIASEAYLADSYWAGRPYERGPRKCKLTGGDSAFVDLPWGWIFQMATANEVAPSGFAVYGLSRLAATTNGRVHLYSPPVTTAHRCAVYGGCNFCSNDHSPSTETYWAGRVAQYAPSVRGRKRVLRDLVGDPFLRATLKAWRSANKAGLVRSNPSVRAAGNALKLERPRSRFRLNLTGGLAFASHAKRATGAARECGRILRILQKDLAGLKNAKGDPRQKAMAKLTAVMLQLAKVNMVSFAGWCRDVAPKLLAQTEANLEPPERPWVTDNRKPISISYTNFCLCHGVRPFYEVDLPGGAALKKELQALESMANEFEALYGHTALAVALHKQGIARYSFSYPGIAGTRPRPRPKSSNEKDPITERGRARPARTGGSSGGTGTPVTGR